MVEYSSGYKAKAAERLEQIEKTLTVQARAVARELSTDFAKSSTKQEPDVPDQGLQAL
ncbi:hypothetical protein RFM23_28355 [Mesorhizobium abyssinicae]|uniref:Uncharacterized protein n=1 Tax=Mesorhizobium abyssinicae TaxID=1209958 RepID=A0ABU5AW47_9HYPH|nr:hypothetical protein [Mesorhizobium abyssinicae]MDX8541542.1 hypothetical protein [Mesorhizobium abyssinicae]